MKLSICMMVKDEEKNLERCLKSLTPLLKSVQGELIIVDTGSSDRTVEIAQSYTDKIYFHPWNNHFAEMRNITISYAKGEWILIIDADEEIQDINELSYFLKEKKLQKAYGVCCVNVLNITDEYNNTKSFITSPRLFKNDGYFKYEGRVHNTPKYKGKSILLHTIFNHYGYISNDSDLMEKKFQRTGELLKRELEKDPDNIYYRYQLSVTYSMHKDWDMGLEQAKIAYEAMKENKISLKNHSYVFGQLVVCCLFNKQYEEGEAVCQEGLSVEDEYIDLYYFLGHIQTKLKRYDHAKKNYNRFLTLVDNFDNLNIRNNLAMNFYTLEKIEEVLVDLAFISAEQKLYSEALDSLEEYISRQEKATKLKRVTVRPALNLIVKVGIELERFDILKKAYNLLVLHNCNEDILNDFFIKLESARSSLTKSKKIELSKLFINGEDNYSILNSMRVALYEDDLSNVLNEASLSLLFSDHASIPTYYGDILYFILKLDMPFIESLFQLREEQIINMISFASINYKELNQYLIKYMEELIKVNYWGQDQLAYRRIRKILLKYLLINGDTFTESQHDYQYYFEAYVEDGTYYISNIYSEKAFAENLISALNNEELFFYYMLMAEKNRVVDDSSCIKMLRKALKAFPVMNKGIDSMRSSFEDQIAATKELSRNAKNVKHTIEQLINSGQIEEAKKIIEEFEMIIPNDIEIFSFKAVILILENDLIQAENILKKALNINGENFDLLYNLAYVYEVIEVNSLAIKYYEKALLNCINQDFKSKIYQKVKLLKKNLSGIG